MRRGRRPALTSGIPSALAILLVLLPFPCSLAAQDMNSEDRIRSLRAASNAALEAHEVDRFMTTIDEDYVGTAGNGGHIRSRDELQALIAGLTADPDPNVWFVRNPDRIEVDASGGRALEVGRWVQQSRAEGVTHSGIGGGYSAYWRRVDGRWLIHGELFVTLGERGPGS